MYLGVDIGGSSVKVGVVNEKGNVVDRISVRTASCHSAEALVTTVFSESKHLLEKYDIECVGVGTPGFVDMKSGYVDRIFNLPFREAPLRDMFGEAFGLPTYLANDANCAAIGELYAGSGADTENFVFVTIGTGVGGGIVIGRKLYFGARGDAGEIGHMSIDPFGKECGCGRRGCWEKYASVSALKERTAAAVKSEPQSILAKFADGHISGRTLFNAERAGCSVAKRELDVFFDYLACGIENLMNIFMPDKIILGGGLSGEGQLLVDRLSMRIKSDIALEISKLGNDAGMIGAAFLYRQVG